MLLQVTKHEKEKNWKQKKAKCHNKTAVNARRTVIINLFFIFLIEPDLNKDQ